MAPVKRRTLQTINYYYQQMQKHYKVLAVVLYGSQNYHLDNPFSDIDAYCIILPDKIQASFTSKGTLNPKQDMPRTIKLTTGNITIKTLAEFMQMFLRQGISTLEALYTPYQVVNPDYQEEWNNLLAMRNKISQFDVYHQILIAHAMMQNEIERFLKDYQSNPYATNPKNLARACHMFFFMGERMHGAEFYQALDTDGKEYQSLLLELKESTSFSFDDDLPGMAVELQKKGKRMWEKYKNTHAALTNEDPAILQLQTELSDVVVPILAKHLTSMTTSSVIYLD
jgi:hypothetical protein